MGMDLQGKTALVTGSGVGTGRAVALALAGRGCAVAVNYSRSKSEAETTAEEVGKLGVKSLALRADVSEETEVRAMTEEVLASFGRLDFLVNNAGITRFIDHADLDGVSYEDWEAIFRTNAWGSFVATRAAVPALRKDGGGAIVNLSSIAGVYATGSSVPYCASKAAINNMTVSLARALAPEIRVNAVAPGFIDTRWWKDREHYEVVKEFATEATPLKRVCQPEDVSKVVVDLLSSELITGQILVVDGGMGIK